MNMIYVKLLGRRLLYPLIGKFFIKALRVKAIEVENLRIYNNSPDDFYLQCAKVKAVVEENRREGCGYAEEEW